MVIEKPLGKSGASAQAPSTTPIGQVFSEPQIYRIDHYLGKETVQNLMALRFANALFEPLWNAAHIDHVQITVAETLGVEGRAGYYDTAGALRDMVQNHMLQLLCLVAMEPPASIDADAVRDEKLKVLQGAEADHGRRRRRSSRCAASTAPAPSDGGAVQGYLEELGAATSQDRDLRRHQGRDRQLALGRRALLPPHRQAPGRRASPRSSSTFKPIPHSIFGDSRRAASSPNRLVIRLQPDEGVKLWLMIKDPGPGGMRLSHVPLDMSFAEAFDVRKPDAYERLLMDVVRGNQTLFMRRDEVEAAWALDRPDPRGLGGIRQTCPSPIRPAPGGRPPPSR